MSSYFNDIFIFQGQLGKELIARRIHEQSGRTGAFIPVNMASTPKELFESEFYGHEKGSFTGANVRKIGLFELADNGTLFIDEVGDIPYSGKAFTCIARATVYACWGSKNA